MHIPKGKPVHENLKTSYVNTTALLADLQIISFTGYLQVIFSYGRGYIFLADGKILNAIDINPDRTRQGEEAIDATLLRASSPDGKISVYSHSEKIVQAIAERIDGEVVYQALSSDFTDLRKLVEKLKPQIESQFYIEIEFSQSVAGIIYIIDNTIDAVLSLENELIEGEAAYEKMLNLLTEQSALFNVYRCKKILFLGQTAANVVSFPDITHTADLSVVTAQTEIVEENDSSLVEVQEIEKNLSSTEEVEYISNGEASNDNIADVSSLTGDEQANSYQKLIDIMTEIIQIVEKVSALVSREANFAVAFRAGLLKVTEQYPVFDPFAEDFSYQNGKIRLATEIPVESLIKGLTKVLKFTLDEMVAVSPNTQLRERIAGALLRLEQLKQEEFESLGISPALAEIITID
jgi:hypothetical protein